MVRESDIKRLDLLIETVLSAARALPKGRESALVVTKLEEAQLWLTRVPR